MVGSSDNSFAAKGAAPVCMVDTYGGSLAGYHIRIRHNTYQANAGTNAPAQYGRGIIFNEGSTTTAASHPAGTFSEFKSNLVWTTDISFPSFMTANHGSAGALTGIDNILDPAGATNNGWYNLALAATNIFAVGKTNVGTPYAVQTTVTVPGLNDVLLPAAPTFVDSTRNLITWYRTKAGLSGRTDAQAPADSTAAIALMKAVNDDGADATYTPANLRTWVRAGWAPTTVALKNAGHDGLDIGAVPGQWLHLAFSGTTLTFNPFTGVY